MTNLLDLKMMVSLFLLLLVEIFTQECGTISAIESRIINGAQSVKGKWPFLAALYYVEDSKFFCGSTLISRKHVLTGDY